jgi:WD40 repeat protein
LLRALRALFLQDLDARLLTLMNSIDAQDFFQPGGSLGPGHPSYVEREADRMIYSALVQGECTCILNARQMGKTSLKNAAKERLAERGILLVSVDLALIGGTLAPDQWYCSVLQEFNRSLEDLGIRTEKTVHAFWLENQQWAPAYRFSRAIRDLLLPATLTPQATRQTNFQRLGSAEHSDDGSPSPIRLILAIDEIDKVRDFGGTWSDDFFGAVRAFYERRDSDRWQRQVGFLLIGVAPPSELIKDANATPFNIGGRIVLNDFTRAEARRLEQGFVMLGQTPEQAAELLDAVMAWTSGHPYLTQRLCYQATRMLAAEIPNHSGQRQRSPFQLVADACRECFLDAGVGSNSSDDNLRNVHLQLTKRLEDDRYVTSRLQDWALREPNKKRGPVLADAKEQRKAAVLNLYDRVLRGKQVRDDYNSNPWVGYLHFSGIVRPDHGRLKIRNRIYQAVFTRRWVQENLPGSFRRAEWVAFGKGIAIATSFAILVFVAGWQLYKQARLNEADRIVETAQAALQQPDQVSSTLELLKRASKYYPDRKRLRDTFVDALARDSLETNRPEEEVTPVSLVWKNPSALVSNLSPAGVPLTWLDFSKDAKCVAAIYPEGGAGRLTVKRLDNDRDLVSRIPCCQAAVAFDSSGDRFAFIDSNGTVHLVETSDGQTRGTNSVGQPENPLAPYRLEFNPNRQRQSLALTSANRMGVLVWDLDSRHEPTPCPSELPLVVRDLAWDPQGTQLAALDQSRIAIWDLQAGPRNALERHFPLTKSTDLSSICLLPGGLTIAGVGAQRNLFLWKVDGHPLNEVEANADPGSRLVSFVGGTFGLVNTHLVRGWHFQPSRIWRSVPLATPPGDGAVSFEMDASGRVLSIAGRSWLTLFDLVEGKALARPKLPGETMTIHEAQFTPGDGDLLVVKEDGVLWWEHQKPLLPAEREHLMVLPRARGIRAVAVSSDQKHMALAHPSRGFQGAHIDFISLERSSLAEIPNPDEWRQWLGQRIEVPVPEGVDRLSFSPDNRVLLGHSSATARLFGWTVSAGDTTNSFQLDDVFDFGFTPRGSWLVIASSVTNRCYSLDQGNLQPLFGFPASQRTPLKSGFAMAALGSEKFLLAQSRSPDTVQICELAPNDKGPNRARDLTQFRIPGGFQIQALRLSPDGSILAALAADSGSYALQLWDLDSMNQFLAKNIDQLPLWTSPNGAQASALAARDFRLEQTQKTVVQLRRTYAFEMLESQLRDLQSSENTNSAALGQKPQETTALLDKIATTSRLLGEVGWEAYFSERARLLKAK